MLEVNPQIYVYALYILVITSISAFLIVVRTIQQTDSERKFPLPNVYRMYFILGNIGFIAVALKDTAHIEMDLTSSVIFYLICSFLLLLASSEGKLSKSLRYNIGGIHIVIAIVSLFLTSDAARLLFISGYCLLIYPVILFYYIQLVKETDNVGYKIISYAISFFVIAIPFQFYFLLVLNDPGFAYGLILVMSSSSFLFMAFGLLTTLLVSEHKQLSHLALTDSLTGLLNRRGMDLTLRVSLGDAARYQKCISAIAIDIDLFKKINDTYGHDGGDVVLKKFGETLLEQMRPNDVACRFGGEEFVVMLPDTEKATALVIAERIRNIVENLIISHDDKAINVTASFGVASDCNEIEVDSLLKTADEAMYKAKEGGRNQVCQS